MSQQTTHATPQAGPAIAGPGDVWRIVWKRIWLILACLVVIGLGGTAGLVAWWYKAPLYTASGIVAVDPGQVPRSQWDPVSQDYISAQMYTPFMMAQTMVIKSDLVLEDALKTVGEDQSMYPASAAGTVPLSEDLDVKYLPRTQNILVSLTGRRPRQVAEIVRGVLESYLERTEQQQSQETVRRLGDLQAERDHLRDQIQDLERQLELYRTESNAVILTERGGEELARLNALTGQLVRKQLELAETRAAWLQFRQLQQQAEEEQNYGPLLMAYPAITDALRRNDEVARLQAHVGELERSLQSLQSRLGEQHKAIAGSQKSLQSVTNELEAVRQSVLAELLQQTGATLKNAYDRARESEAELRDQVAEARQEAIKIGNRAAEYQARLRDYQRVRNQLDNVLQGLDQLRLQSAMAQQNIRVVQWPRVPIEPSEPRLLLYIPAVILFSLLLGVGLSFLLEFVDNKLRTPAQVVRQVGVPILGTVPDLAEDDRLSLDTDVAKVSHVAPQSLLAEAFRQFRTNLRFSSNEPIKSLLVTSPHPGDGKTATAVNLAITIARTGSRVLLVEANFRRPALARVWDLPDRVGLSNVLVGLNSVDEAIQATRVENLDVLVGGPQPPSPADLLGSERMSQLVRDLTERYDHVILDAAPVLLVADMHLLAQAMDGVVLVYRAGENTRGLALRAARQLAELGSPLLGAVLNGVRATKGGYFREVYQAYYDYSGPAPQSVLARSGVPAQEEAVQAIKDRAEESASQDRPE